MSWDQYKFKNDIQSNMAYPQSTQLGNGHTDASTSVLGHLIHAIGAFMRDQSNQQTVKAILNAFAAQGYAPASPHDQATKDALNNLQNHLYTIEAEVLKLQRLTSGAEDIEALTFKIKSDMQAKFATQVEEIKRAIAKSSVDQLNTMSGELQQAMSDTVAGAKKHFEEQIKNARQAFMDELKNL